MPLNSPTLIAALSEPEAGTPSIPVQLRAIRAALRETIAAVALLEVPRVPLQTTGELHPLPQFRGGGEHVVR